MEGDRARLTREWDEARSLNYELTALHYYAVNDPKNMPKFVPSTEKAKSDPARVAEVANIRARGNLIREALRAKARKK
nr:hypothetical protein [Rubellimicrobium arenae]